MDSLAPPRPAALDRPTPTDRRLAEASLSPDLSSVGRERYEYDGVACVVAGGPGGGQLPVFIRELELSG